MMPITEKLFGVSVMTVFQDHDEAETEAVRHFGRSLKEEGLEINRFGPNRYVVVRPHPGGFRTVVFGE